MERDQIVQKLQTTYNDLNDGKQYLMFATVVCIWTWNSGVRGKAQPILIAEYPRPPPPREHHVCCQYVRKGS